MDRGKKKSQTRRPKAPKKLNLATKSTMVKSANKSTQVKNIVDNFKKTTQVENIVDKSTPADRIYQEHMKNLSRGLLERCQMRKDRLHNLANDLNTQGNSF